MKKMFNITNHWEMPIKSETTVRHHFRLLMMAIIREKKSNKCWQGCLETLEPAYIAAENVKRCSHFGKQLGSSSKY